MGTEVRAAPSTPTPPNRMLAELVSSLPWLTNWSPTEPVPSEGAARLPAAIATAREALKPCDARAFAVAMDRLIAWGERFGLVVMDGAPEAREAGVRGIVGDYRAALADLPADLLAGAVQTVIATYSVEPNRFRRLPLPGDLRAKVADMLAERRMLVRRLETAAFVARRLKRVERPEPPRRPPTPEQAVRVRAQVQAVSEALAGVNPVPARRDDDATVPSDRAAIVRRVTAETAGRRRIPKPWERAASGGGADS